MKLRIISIFAIFIFLLPATGCGAAPIDMSMSDNASDGTLLSDTIEPIQTPSLAPDDTPPLIKTPTPMIDEGWWTLKWSNDGKALKVDYVRVEKESGSSGGSSIIRDLDNSGKVLEKVARANIEGTDRYGREWRETEEDYYEEVGGLTELTTSVADGEVTHFTGFSHTSSLKLDYEYNEDGFLTGGSGSEVSSGSLPGGITYSGSSNITYGFLEGDLGWTKRIERTTYSKDGGFYAETLMTTVPESAKSPIFYQVVRETVWTTTTYADGSRRESKIVILYDWDNVGNNTGKSAQGTITGTDIMAGLPVDYSGFITITYVNIGGAWEKISFEENRSSIASLTQRLPFEAIFCDDHTLSPGLY